MAVELKVMVNSTELQLASAVEYLERMPQVDLSLLAQLPEVDQLIVEINEFLKDMVNDIISFISDLKEGLEWLAPELQKIKVMLDMIIASAKTFTGLLNASLSINTSTGQEIMNFSAHASFAGKMEEVLGDVSRFVDKAVPDHQMLVDLAIQLEKAKGLLINIRDKVLL
ncbi:hypothetical protein [Reichenbachiella sp.]|uniref:hypothetical protein n=1 Tax=Reichenbachiella sp. TaxID=2184521 RepID=UPI003BAFC9EE